SYPSDPTIVTYHIPESCSQVDVKGNYAYISNFEDGLIVLDLTSDPDNPTYTVYDTLGIAVNVTVDGNYAYVADEKKGVIIFDISNPSALEIVSYYETPGKTETIVTDNELIYVSDLRAGLWILRNDLMKYSITGTIMTADSAPLQGVSVTIAGDQGYTIQSDETGQYAFMGLLTGNYVVSAAKDGYTFEPAQYNYAPLDANQANQNFVGTLDEEDDGDDTEVEPADTPSITSISPLSGKTGTTIDLSVYGTNFTADTTISFSGSGINIISTDFVSAEQINLRIRISADAVLGLRTITAENADNTSGSLSDAFAIQEGVLVSGSQVKIQGGSKGYVNPKLNESVKIHFNAAGSGSVETIIYTLRGQKVREYKKDVSSGAGTIDWDCKNSDGSTVTSGIYIVYIKGPGFKTTKKIAVVK
ncbi:MAG: carboxypeptidase regulatory-like domain-containing protein, partial [bacterium]